MLLRFTCFDRRSPTPHRISNNNSEARITVAEPTQRLQTQQLNHKLVEHAHMFTPAHVALTRKRSWSLDISGGVFAFDFCCCYCFLCNIICFCLGCRKTLQIEIILTFRHDTSALGRMKLETLNRTQQFTWLLIVCRHLWTCPETSRSKSPLMELTETHRSCADRTWCWCETIRIGKWLQ